MKTLINFFNSVRAEWFKIVWPDFNTVMKSTIRILIFAGLAALFFFITDSILTVLVEWIY